MKKHLFLLSAVFVVATLLRVVGITSYPIGFTQDEAGLGYDSYSILKTGRDQWGTTLPLTLRSFGDFKLPAYSYLTTPAVFLFGLNKLAVRLPGAVAGSLAVVATYLMVQALSKRKDLALLSALFLATSPWHISLSRGAFEANLTTLFLPLAVWSFIKGIEKPKWMVLSALFFGINIFTYHAARYLSPLVLLALTLAYRRKIRQTLGSGSIEAFLKRYKLSLVVLLLFVGAAALSMFTGAARRGLDITIFNPTDHWKQLADSRYEAIVSGVPETIARAFYNKPLYVFKTFTNNYLSYFSPAFLFTQGVSEWGYGMISGRGVMYLFEILLILAALVSFLKNNGFKNMNFILIWLVLAPLPAALTKGMGMSGTRAGVMMPAIQIVSAWGAIYIFERIKEKYSFRTAQLFLSLLLILLSLSLAAFLESYRYHAPLYASKAMQYPMAAIIAQVSELEKDYDGVVLSRTLSVPNIWVEFYEKLDPVAVQRASKTWLRYEAQGVGYLDQIDEYTLGKYTFGDIVMDDIKGRNLLVVGREWEFPAQTKPLASFNYLNGEPAYVLVDANEL